MTTMFQGRDFTARIMPIAELAARNVNPRTHSRSQLRKLVNSLEMFGWTNPLLIDEVGVILCGHGRFEAAKLAGLTEIPVITLRDLSEAQKRAYVIADNAIAAKAGWSKALLAAELKGLIDIGFDVEVTGFDMIEIDEMLTVFDSAGDAAEEDIVPPLAAGQAISNLGDLWTIGCHRILCASALESENYLTLMAGEMADMAFVDPPFNVAIAGNVSGLGKVIHADFAMGVGEMSPDQFTAFLRQTFRLMRSVSRPGAIHYICMDWRHLREVLDAAEGTYAEFKNLCVWAKTNAGMGTFYRSQHELVLVFKASAGKHPTISGLARGVATDRTCGRMRAPIPFEMVG